MILGLLAGGVSGHGRLMDPPGRGSVWRFVDSNPLITPYSSIVNIDYTDQGLNCGGLSYQVSQGGKCGVCGDAFGDVEPRQHEDGGKYGKGIITAQYQPGQIITTSTQITAHHKGWVEFKLCPRNDEIMTGDELQVRISNLALSIWINFLKFFFGIFFEISKNNFLKK